ncbi:MAG: hypothetical protein JXK05_01360 [Campylobacterales bacterium]|nr:hypothetical protein [Campylobacterales bacterium]
MKEKADMLDEYDFSKGGRGKYADAYHKGTNVVKIDDDITQVFPDTKSVNEALRTLIKLLQQEPKTA